MKVLNGIVLAATIAAFHAVAQAGTYQDNDYIQWEFTVNADGGATITGASPGYYDPMYGSYYYWGGSIPSFVCDGSDWDASDTWYPVTAIGDNALSGIAYIGSGTPSGVTSIYIPDTVKRIGDSVFSGFSYVMDIDLPDGLEYLGQYAFDGCTSLSYDMNYYDLRVLDGWVLGPWQSWEVGYSYIESADMSAVKGIAAGAFSGCEYLRSVNLPVNMVILPYSAFNYCTSLTDIVIPASVTNIEAWAFSNCSSLTNITFVGNAPTLSPDPYDPTTPGSNPFDGVSPQCVVTVQQGTTGWGTVPGTWNGLPTQYATAPSTYTVTWLNDDGTLLDENSSWVYGAIPSHTNLVKASDAQYDYEFWGWTPEPEPVISNTTYTAVYTPHLRYYTITWLNDNGSRIRQSSVGYGTTPTPPAATKAATAFYTYTLSGWTPEIVSVTGPATYRATYTAHQIYAGSGTAADPFIATSGADLAALVAATNTLYVRLAEGLSVTGPLNVPASMSLLSIDMNGGTITGANGSPAIVLAGNTEFSATGTGTISADEGVEAVRRPGTVAAASGVTITGMCTDGATLPTPAFGESGDAATTKFEKGANGKWTLTAFAELSNDALGKDVANGQIKVYAADAPEGLASAAPLSSGVTIDEKKCAVKAKITVTPPNPSATKQFFKVKFGE